MSARALTLALALSALAAPAARADIVDEFMALCYKSIGNPVATAKAAKKAGYNPRPFGQRALMGGNTKKDTSLQVNFTGQHAYECAVTTSDAKKPDVIKDKFFDAIGLTPKGNKARGEVKGASYTFEFSSKGGESLVVYRD